MCNDIEELSLEEIMSQKDSLIGQKYFIFKIYEYIKNSNHTLQNKRWESLRALLVDCIDIQEEINTTSGENERQHKSLKYVMDALIFYCNNNPLTKYIKINREINYLIKQIDISGKNDGDKEGKDTRDFIAIYNSIKSFLKRLERINISSLHIDIMKDNNLSFKEIDNLLDSFMSELLYDGYSIKYLENWYIDNIHNEIKGKELNKEDIENILDKFRVLSCEKKENYVILNSWIPKELRDVILETGKDKIKVKYDYEILKELPDNIENNFSKSPDNLSLKVKIISCDEYSAISIAKDNLENYFELFKEINGYTKSNVCNSRNFIVSNDDLVWNPIIREEGDSPELKIYKNIDSRETEDIKDFNKLRLKLSEQDIDSFDISVLERVLGITKNTSELSKENRLLNLWSALEYVLTFYHRNSIIERARQVIPKVISIYYIKEKMNTLWERLKIFRTSKNLSEELKDFFSECSSQDNSNKYNKEAFIKYIADRKKAEKLYMSVTNVIIQREIAELNSLLDIKKAKDGTTKRIIIENHRKIDNDLNRIYRIRNKIVHSGSNIPENIDIITIRLFKYINGLMRTLIHYINLNNTLTISEILYSITQTYAWYISILDEKNKDKEINVQDIGSPMYLYL